MIDPNTWKRIAMRAASIMAALLIPFVIGACAGPKSIDMDVTANGQVDSGDPNRDDPSLPQISEETLLEIAQLDGIPDEGSLTPPPVMNHADDYQKSRNQNADVVGWISIPNTRIEYPVVRTTDNEYYLTRDIEHNRSKSGTVFMDFRNTDTDSARHILIYGHNMRNGSMFHALNNFKVKDFFANNRDITLYLGDKAVKFEIYAAFVISAELNFMETNFRDDETFIAYMNELKDMSKFTAKPAVTLDADDQILTLVTCTYEYDDSRFAVQARRVS